MNINTDTLIRDLTKAHITKSQARELLADFFDEVLKAGLPTAQVLHEVAKQLRKEGA